MVIAKRLGYRRLALGALQALSSTVSAAAFGILTASVVLTGGVWLFFHRRKSRTAIAAC